MQKVQLSLLDLPVIASDQPHGASFIPLTQGMSAIVDVEDFEWLSQYRWRAFPNSKSGKSEDYSVYYAVRSNGRKNIKMHREILERMGHELTPEIEIDHRNGNSLDNRRSNLRIATRSQNQANRPPRSASGFKGVYPSGNQWVATIKFRGQRERLGVFQCPEQAAIAYNRRAIELFGEFAYLNPVQEVG